MILTKNIKQVFAIHQILLIAKYLPKNQIISFSIGKIILIATEVSKEVYTKDTLFYKYMIFIKRNIAHLITELPILGTAITVYSTSTTLREVGSAFVLAFSPNPTSLKVRAKKIGIVCSGTIALVSAYGAHYARKHNRPVQAAICTTHVGVMSVLYVYFGGSKKSLATLNYLASEEAGM